MLYEKTTEMYMGQIANIKFEWVLIDNCRFLKSVDQSYPARMMMKMKRLKLRQPLKPTEPLQD